MEKEMKFCQSCGMPLSPEVLGTNADGSKNEDYCMYCYKDGKFLQECTMDQMIEHCAQSGTGTGDANHRIKFRKSVITPVLIRSTNIAPMMGIMIKGFTE